MKWVLTIAAIAALACSSAAQDTGDAPRGGVEQGAPNAPWQRPALPGQTRAPGHRSGVAFDVITVADGLDHPWGLAFLPDGRMLVTERAGRLRLVGTDGRLSDAIAGLPPIDVGGQGGLLDVALDPSFISNHFVYWSYSEPQRGGANNTAVARGQLVDALLPHVDHVQVIFHQTPSLDSSLHFGGRLVFARDGTLFVTLGERSITQGRMQAQRLNGTLGKIVRINADGSIPPDNPLVGRSDARPEIWSIGHRNVQAATLHPETGELWEIEHGTRGGDEINIARAGKDYGWPTIAYGIEYAGGPITGGITAKDGMEQPLYYWDPVIAPSGMTFYTGDLFPEWKGSLFVGGLASQALVRLVVDGERVTGEERLLTNMGHRIRAVAQGLDGALYLLTDESRGQILKLIPMNQGDALSSRRTSSPR
jgi:aldose sugar dehydrogenase